MEKPELSAKNQIERFLHCWRCLKEKPNDVSPREWSRTQIGWTQRGFQVWCNRHESNIANIDFEGARHPAITHTHVEEHENEQTENHN